MAERKIMVCIYLLAISGIDEISAIVVERIEEPEASFFVHGTHPSRGPFVADAHGTKLKWGYMNTCVWGEATKTSELGGWFWCRGPKRHDRRM